MPAVMTLDEAVAMARSRLGRHDQRIFTADDVRLIRIAYGSGTKINTLARQFGTTWTTIRDCVTRKHYADIE